MKHSLTLAIVGALGILGAVAGTVSARPDTDTKPAAAKSEKADKSARESCFNSDTIQGFNPVDDNHLEITDYRGRTFMLEVGGACFGLGDTLRLGLRTRGGSQRVCGPFDADVIYRDAASDRLRTCQIISVTETTPATATDKAAG